MPKKKITARHLRKLQKRFEEAGGTRQVPPVSTRTRDIEGETRAIELAVALPSVGQPGYLKKYKQLVKFVDKLPWASQEAVETTAKRMGLAKKKGIDIEVQRAVAASPKLTALQARQASRFEPGQRVDVLTYDDRVIPGKHTVVDGSRWGLDNRHFVRVRRVLGNERTTDNWPIDRVRQR